MFDIIVECEFAAAHHLANYPGNCSRVHGHNWKVIVTFRTENLDENGIGIDFRVAKSILEKAVKKYDHFYLNQLADFSHRNPTCEIIAKTVFDDISAALSADVLLNGIELVEVMVWESPSTRVIYRGVRI